MSRDMLSDADVRLLTLAAQGHTFRPSDVITSLVPLTTADIPIELLTVWSETGSSEHYE